MDSGTKLYPFWRPDFRQNPFSLPGRGVESIVRDLGVNQTPLRDSEMSDVRLVMVPRLPQDAKNISQGDKMQVGVGQPGYSLARLNAGIDKQKGGTP